METICCQFDIVYDQKKRSRVIRGRRDILYDPKVTVTFLVSQT